MPQLAVKKSCLKYSRNRKKKPHTYKLRGFALHKMARYVYPEYIMKATKDSRFQLKKTKKECE